MLKKSRKGSEIATNMPIYMILGLLVLIVGAVWLITTTGEAKKTTANLQACGGVSLGNGVCKDKCDASVEVEFDGLGCKDTTPKCCILKNGKDSENSPQTT